MTDKPFDFWTECGRAAEFSQPQACEQRATRFERTIRNRNAIEYAAGALTSVLFSAMTITAALKQEWLFAGSGLMCLAAIVFVIVKLYRFGSNLERRPELNCREHLRAQFERQRKLLHGVPLWYIAPIGLGILSVYGVVTFEVAQRAGWDRALNGIALPLGVTVAFLVGIAALNLWAARTLKRRVAELDALA